MTADNPDESKQEIIEEVGEAPEKMKKGVKLRVNLWIEGEDAPAHNFAESTTKAVREIIEAGSAKHPELKVEIKSIKEG